MQNFLTIDNGGTNTKVVIVSATGKQLGVAAFPTKGIEPQPNFHEIELDHLLEDIGVAVKQALSNAHLNPEDISGVTTVGHGKGLYVLNKQMRPFRNGILSADSRAEQLAEHFEQHVGQIFEVSHQHILASQAPVLLRWLKDNRPSEYRQIGAVLSNKDFIRFLLTGEAVQERGDASGNNLLDLLTGQYDERLTKFFGISEIFQTLPPLVNATDQCGTISEAAAQITGLTVGIPVYAGMFDIDACAIATGVLDSQLFSVIAGTWNMNIFPSNQMAEQGTGLMNSLFPTGNYLVEASSPTSAGNLNIIIKMLMTAEIRDAEASGKTIYDNLESFLETTDATFSQVLFYPFLYGSNRAPDAEGSFIGIRSTTTKSEMIKAVYEGVCFAHRQHLEQLVKVLGHQPRAIRMSGGACNSPSWVQMFADVFNLPIELTDVSELGGLGGAITIAVGSHLFGSFSEAVNHMSHVTKIVTPNTESVALYNRKYAMYEKFGAAMDGQWKAFNQMQKEMAENDN